MHCVLLIIFFSISIPLKGSLGNEIHDLKHKNDSDFNLNQSQEVDLVIDGLKQIFDENTHEPNLRKNVKSINKVKSEMQIVGRNIFGKIQYVLNYLGLFRSNNKFMSSIHRLINNDIRSSTVKDEVLRQYLSLANLIPLHSQIVTNINNHYHKSNYRRKGYAPSNLNLYSGVINNDDVHGFKWITLIEKLSNLVIKSLGCLNSKKWFDISKSFSRIVQNSLDIIKRIITTRLSRNIPKNPRMDGPAYSDFQALVCHILVRDLKKDFTNCLQQVKAIEICSAQKSKQSSDKSLVRMSKSFKQNLNNNVAGKCSVKSINETLITFCENGSKNNLTQSFIFLFSRPVRDKLINSPDLKYIMDYIGKVVINNDVGSTILKELVGMKSVFEPRINTQSNKAKKLKNNLSKIILRTINRVHEMNTGIEKKLINTSGDLKMKLSNNLRTMRCIYELIDMILNSNMYGFNQTKSDKSNMSRKMNINNDGKVFIKKHGFDYYEKPVKDLVISMKHLAEINSRKSSTIFTLANTFLLATVFYECISILVTLMYRGDNNHILPSNPTDHNHSHNHNEGYYGTITTENVNGDVSNYEDYDEQQNRIYRREAGEQYTDFSSVRESIYENNETFDYSNFYDVVFHDYVYKKIS
ncbi:uncharacterized protein LOC130670736 [Microplitis mediator]|uniref:uncharacterized protein LOC130670736 n=1 Tax=Microplitis mediator TaxID=375433 RepID=UPI002553CF30|nr:uncharacterized protein LOC130670736 [Microplitis mediator]